MPLVHVPTMDTQGLPEMLLNVMRCVGAVFVKTRKAANFVNKVLSSKEDLIREFVSDLFIAMLSF